jgi:hypothetical protein
MKNAIRTHVAAALLLFPLAGAIVAQPAQAQQRAVVAQASVAPAPVIDRFVMRPAGRLVAGRELRFRLVGVPGADASLNIPGVVRGLDLKETRPGVYEGSYTIRRRDNLQAFDRAVATLRSGNVRSTARLDLSGGDRDWGQREDNSAPRISDVTPRNGGRVDERGRTFIQARLSDTGSGVDTKSVRLTVDGLDVTPNARVTDEAVGYRERLGRGQHRAELMVRDRAGNVTRSAWTFAVI